MAPSSSRPLSVSLSASSSTTSLRDLEGGIGGALLLRTLLQNLEAQRRVERADLRDQAALQARAHAIVEAVELAGRPGRSHHHLAAAVEQRIDDVLELLLGLLAAHELEVVDQQDVDRAEFVLERHARPGLLIASTN